MIQGSPCKAFYTYDVFVKFFPRISVTYTALLVVLVIFLETNVFLEYFRILKETFLKDT